MKRALIFGGGEYGEHFPDINKDDFIIAADKGYEILRSHGFEPHITVGDFDSSEKIPEKNAVVLPVEKDITDSHAAVNIATEKGFEEIVIYGGMGGRPDHSFGNYTLIAALSQKSIRAFLVGETYTVTAVTDGSIEIYGRKGKTVSVFSWSEKSTGVSYKGLYYPLENAELKNNFGLGVSNSMLSDTAEISVGNGTLLIMYEN